MDLRFRVGFSRRKDDISDHNQRAVENKKQAAVTRNSTVFGPMNCVRPIFHSKGYDVQSSRVGVIPSGASSLRRRSFSSG
mmetsp:Transcript_86/g.155  ORF Transcript_86/g.155 Transcript_86/m.155 type:complete len:80 (-) Transcript_86:1298-1537(-)